LWGFGRGEGIVCFTAAWDGVGKRGSEVERGGCEETSRRGKVFKKHQTDGRVENAKGPLAYGGGVAQHQIKGGNFALIRNGRKCVRVQHQKKLKEEH